jgi:plastocyanin
MNRPGVLLCAAGLAAAIVGCTRSGPREVLIVARGMTFTLPSNPSAANPTIRLAAGDQVKLTLRNDAPGLMHDFRIPAWKIQTDQIRAGDSTSVTFTVPSASGRVEYHCGPHATMMRGVIEVMAQ